MSAQDFLEHFAPVPQIAARVNEIRFTEAGCWEWPSESYGRVYVGGERRQLSTHRTSLALKVGRELGDDFACHVCDNPPCCNPAHLFAGSPGDNVRDAWVKGRATAPPVHRGVRNVHAAISDEAIVDALRAVESGEPLIAVARRLGVSKETVHNWRRGKTRAEALAAYSKKRVA